MKKGYVYILECSNGQLYTGSTINIEQRLNQHKNGTGANFTRKNPPKRLLYCCEFPTIQEAFRHEKQIKGWSRAKKWALIQGHFEKLPVLSQSKTTLQQETKPNQK